MEIDAERPSILLHSCCGPCSTAVIERLERDFRLTVFFYNPNITDQAEYLKRKAAQVAFLEAYNAVEPIGYIEGDYEPDVFLTMAERYGDCPEGGARCDGCFRLRLEKTALRALADGFDGFCTTLSVSPHKNAMSINATGAELERTYGVKYIVSDFKKKDGYRRSVEMAGEFGLYRQHYCGCDYSKQK